MNILLVLTALLGVATAYPSDHREFMDTMLKNLVAQEMRDKAQSEKIKTAVQSMLLDSKCIVV